MRWTQLDGFFSVPLPFFVVRRSNGTNVLFAVGTPWIQEHLAWRGQIMSLHFICHAIEKDKRMNRDSKLTLKSIARVFDVTRALFDTYQARTLSIELFRFSLNIILNNELICTYLFKSSTQTPKTHGLLRQANPADTDCGPLTRMLTAIDRTIPMLWW